MVQKGRPFRAQLGTRRGRSYKPRRPIARVVNVVLKLTCFQTWRMHQHLAAGLPATPLGPAFPEQRLPT